MDELNFIALITFCSFFNIIGTLICFVNSFIVENNSQVNLNIAYSISFVSLLSGVIACLFYSKQLKDILNNLPKPPTYLYIGLQIPLIVYLIALIGIIFRGVSMREPMSFLYNYLSINCLISSSILLSSHYLSNL